jgi:hypothetical protein
MPGRPALVAGAVLLGAVIGTLTSSAGRAVEEVRFSSAPVPPTPLRSRLAKERGLPSLTEPTVQLIGDLYPQCGDLDVYAPALILIGALDDSAEGALLNRLGRWNLAVARTHTRTLPVRS